MKGYESEDDEFYDSSASRKPAEQALGLVRDLLSPAVRIRERRAAGIPYYAALEARVGAASGDDGERWDGSAILTGAHAKNVSGRMRILIHERPKQCLDSVLV